jgi:hypothetical protein
MGNEIIDPGKLPAGKVPGRFERRKQVFGAVGGGSIAFGHDAILLVPRVSPHPPPDPLPAGQGASCGPRGHVMSYAIARPSKGADGAKMRRPRQPPPHMTMRPGDVRPALWPHTADPARLGSRAGLAPWSSERAQPVAAPACRTKCAWPKDRTVAAPRLANPLTHRHEPRQWRACHGRAAKSRRKSERGLPPWGTSAYKPPPFAAAPA